ncbi:MAG: 3-deoxy-D-manno-octulosonic acid transferase [Deltaproteobacteria bacterium]|nr:3-deoxy-D-manno-octulosonic acid transferase [Deltaproteobacteria bacterium]MBW2017034.1 3-deoxy-D-manno-octulosonic acid transferase [Deltaproteobacteria bacterium]MBW2128966.1 3-deoxy-D-manno-octulosonic acid transferase [Deltaproteobacteria bacterium]MBW2302939.1 3-deoxy-D-manno-octulosonic acid transferase [Deltaproteobacteria bacterium]
MFFYHLLWTLLLLPASPLLFKGDSRLRERLLPNPTPCLPREGTLWIHALSVGEVISAQPLVKALVRAYPNRPIAFSVSTRQGMEIARESLAGKVNTLFFMPLDFWWSMRRVIHILQPALFLLVETDLWPGLLRALKKRGVPSLLVNGRISPRTFHGYKRFRHLACSLLNTLDGCLMQTDLDTRRLLEIGVRPDKVFTAGNIKFDRDWKPMEKEEMEHWRNLLGLEAGERVWVAGSTHEGEEEILFRVFLEIRSDFPGLKMVLAPRRIERSGEVYQGALEMGLSAVLRSRCESKGGSSYDVMILDTLGELGRIYGIGSVSFVGGSLVPIGGHNLLEPASFGTPVLFGPHTFNFDLMSRNLVEAGGGIRVGEQQGLSDALRTLLGDPAKRDAMGRKAKKFVVANQGALSRVLKHVDRCLS